MKRKPTPYELALWAALPMAHTTRIEGRLTMILDATRPRRALTRRALLTALGLSAAALVPLAVLHPSARAQAAAPSAASSQHRHKEIIHVTPTTPAFVWTANTSVAVMGGDPIQFVQLAGIASPGTLKWWGVDGTRLPQPVFDLATVPRVEGLTDLRQRRVQLAFRLPATVQGVTVKYALSDSLNSSSDGSWLSKMQSTSHQTETQLNARTSGVRVVTATFPASISRTNVRVGIAFGPWKTAATDTHDTLFEFPGYMSTSTREGNSHKFIFSRPIDISSVQTKSNVVLTISTDTTDDLRVVAVTTQGQTVLPYQIGDNSIGTLDQITVHFALPLAQIKAIRVETRPFRWVEFKNVALQPAG